MSCRAASTGSSDDGTCLPITEGQLARDDACTCDGEGACSSAGALWAKSFGNGLEMGRLYPAVAPTSGAIFVGGTYEGTMSVEGVVLPPSEGDNQDLFMARFSPSGQIEWARNYGNTGEAESYDMLYAPTMVSGRLVMAGTCRLAFSENVFESTTDCGPTSDTLVFGVDETTGDAKWRVHFGYASDDTRDRTFLAATDTAPGAFVVTSTRGSLTGDVSLSKTAKAKPNLRDLTVVRLDEHGSPGAVHDFFQAEAASYPQNAPVVIDGGLLVSGSYQYGLGGVPKFLDQVVGSFRSLGEVGSLRGSAKPPFPAF